MKRNLVQIPLFTLSISDLREGAVAVFNNRTGKFANKGLKPLKQLEKEFKIYFCDHNQMFFERVPKDRIKRMEELLPKTKLTCN